MLLYTPVALPPSPLTLMPGDGLVTLGSCFAQGVGERLQRLMGEENAEVNPFGVLYNPLSVAGAVSALLRGEPQDDKIFLGRDGLWHSWLHSSHFSAATREACREGIARRLSIASERLKRARLLVCTFGTTRCYELLDGTLVTNCHKEPASTFREREPSEAEMLATWRETLTALRHVNPSIVVCLTVSPYRYRKYGYHESQLQKARLLLLSDALCRDVPGVCYFPAYEILLDELRDYRFYAPDMLHPSEQAADIIAARFTRWTFSEELLAEGEVRLREWRRSQHRSIT